MKSETNKKQKDAKIQTSCPATNKFIINIDRQTSGRHYLGDEF